jgi:3-oxoacyl-[acyl-carrier protein] reductase
MLELRKEGIRVITVCPGSVDTGMLRDQPMLNSNPARILQPEDVAEAILQALRLPERALVSEIDIRPANP